MPKVLTGGAIVAGAAIVVAGAPVVVAAVGFGSGGIASGSLAASLMSTASTTGVGMGAVSALQSAGAAGIGLGTQVALGTAGAGAGVGLKKAGDSGIQKFKSWFGKSKDNEGGQDSGDSVPDNSHQGDDGPDNEGDASESCAGDTVGINDESVGDHAGIDDGSVEGTAGMDDGRVGDTVDMSEIGISDASGGSESCDETVVKSFASPNVVIAANASAAPSTIHDKRHNTLTSRGHENELKSKCDGIRHASSYSHACAPGTISNSHYFDHQQNPGTCTNVSSFTSQEHETQMKRIYNEARQASIHSPESAQCTNRDSYDLDNEPEACDIATNNNNPDVADVMGLNFRINDNDDDNEEDGLFSTRIVFKK